MALNSYRHVPAKASAGLTFNACYEPRCPSDPIASSATLMLRGPAVIDIAGVASGVTMVFAVDAATTATWAAGTYWYSLRVEDSSGVREVENGQIDVLPDFADLPAGYDGRTQNEIALDAINAVLGKRATQDQMRYTIDNRELWRTPMGDLIKLQAFYTSKVRRERAAREGRPRFGRPIHVRFQ